MNHFFSKMLCAAILLAGATGLSALGDVRTGIMTTAIPKNGVRFFYSNGFQSRSVKDNSDNNNLKTSIGIGGGTASLLLSPRTEASVWISHNNSDTCFELHGKYLLRSADDYHFSIGLGAYNSEGVKKDTASGVNYERDRCVVNGIMVPILYSLDTKYNVLMNVGAAINYDWVTISGAERFYNSDSHQWIIKKFKHDPVGVLRGQLDYSLEAHASSLTMLLENGISFVDAGDQGLRRIYNIGIMLGISF